MFIIVFYKMVSGCLVVDYNRCVGVLYFLEIFRVEINFCLWVNVKDFFDMCFK